MPQKLKQTIPLLFICLIFLTACKSTTLESTLPEGPTKTLVDSIGRTVVIPDNPQKVGCLYTNTGHIITMLGSGDTIVAVSNGLKRDKLLQVIQPSIAESTLVKTGSAVNIEELLNLQVDLMIIPSDMFSDQKLISQLDQYKIPIVVTKFDSIKEQQDLVTLLGSIFNAQEEALAYNALYNDIIEEVKSSVSMIPEDQRTMVYHSLNEATNTVPDHSLPSEWMSIAGGIDVSINNTLNQDSDKYYASLEQILLWNPDVIFCNEDGVDNYIRTNEQWSILSAVKNDSVYLMPTGISRWGHSTSIETPLAMLWTAQTLYPNECESIDLKAYTLKFYKDLFEYDLTDEQYDSIIAGRGMRIDKDATN